MGPQTDDEARPVPHDLRLPAVAVAAWLGAIAARSAGAVVTALLGAAAAVALLGLVLRRVDGKVVRLACACLLVASGVAAVALVRGDAAAHGMLAGLAEQRAFADLTGTVVSDPATLEGPYGRQVVVRVRVASVAARGATYRLGAVVVVIGTRAWDGTELGATVGFSGRLAPADEGEVAALVTGARDPVRIRGPDVWWRGAAAVRASIRRTVSARPSAERALVPALVDGDDGEVPTTLQQDFRTTGLTHLTAVSGTNLTLVLGALLLVARGAGVRRRWLTVVGLLGVAGFVLLARTEPSVLRAAAMGTVGLFALGTDGRRRGLRALGVAVTGLLLVSPGLAVSAGFALSVLATAGIVVLGPPVQESLGRWLPRPVAAAIAVPFAAQLACTPVVAALSGGVSLVAVLANLLVEPVVGPATVLGLAGGLVGLVCPSLGRLLGLGASLCVRWIVAVAERGADLPLAAVSWGAGPVAIGVLVLVCLLIALLAPVLLRRRSVGALVIVGTLLVILGVPGKVLPGPGTWFGDWPPKGWVLVACDVGQGDALVLSVRPGVALVVDTGPDPTLVDHCLDRLGVREVPLVVLTHYHADHVDGLDGVLRGRSVHAIEASPMLDPTEGVDQVHDIAARAGLTVTTAPVGLTRTFGGVTLEDLWPDLPAPVPGPGDGSAANDNSVVLLVESHGLRLLLTGDVEPTGQQRLAAALPGLDIDVLKVPHHGSSHQDLDWLHALRAEAALVSVGVDNDYGHPDADLLASLAGDGTVIARTDRDGDIAVLAGERGPVVVTDH
ncbi:ComEC/Rec2 family competence protein [Nocardioides sp. MH1]|uniref:ComEC/Rec2 family competence protein n=1 Tax=Nocardioides sp. MH1 TaxID=3242490 RepID=UPI003521BFB2